MDLRITIRLIVFVCISRCGTVLATDSLTNNSNSETFKIINWKFQHLKTYIIYTIFIIIVVLMKIIYIQIPNLSSYIPESCVLVIAGVLFGLIIRFFEPTEIQFFKLTPHLFFSILLPPLALESSYSLYHRNFWDNLLSILVFAIFGTLLNFLIIGLSLWGLSKFGSMENLNLDLLHCLLFSSLIISVDPIGVLAVFQDVGVNTDLYYLVFGESLLNDAVTVALYIMMQEFAKMPIIGGTNIFLGFLSFFTVSFGGLFVGFVVGCISCLIIRLMAHDTMFLLEPILLMSTGYFAYLAGDVFGWSGVISTVACGVIQTDYAFHTISDKSRFVLKRFVKILSTISETLIFLFLGVELIVGKLSWDSSFSITALFLCFISRFIVTFLLSGIINQIHISMRFIPLTEKIIMSYGGLRGAVSFSLAILIEPAALPATGINSEIIITTTLFIILFTIIVQGTTLKPLVNVLQIARKAKSKPLTLFSELSDSVFDASTCGINSILGKCGRNFFIVFMERINRKYIRPILQGSSTNPYYKMIAINEKISQTFVSDLREHPSTDDLQRELPTAYVNLVGLLTKEKKIVETIKPVYRQGWGLPHPTSDIIILPPAKVVKRLHPHFIRVSSINAQEDPYELRQILNIYERASNIDYVKTRFNNFKGSEKEEKLKTMRFSSEN